MIKQNEQDNLWQHFQNQATDVFDLSYSRLRFLANRCDPSTNVLNIGVGTGLLEKLLIDRGVETYSLDPVADSIDKLKSALNTGEIAKQGYATAIPFENDYFDSVIMTEVLEHIPPDDLHATFS